MKCVCFCGISFSAPWHGLEQVVSAADAAFERKYTKKDKNVYSEIAKKVKAWSAKKSLTLEYTRRRDRKKSWLDSLNC